MLLHTYNPPKKVDFAGPSYLGHVSGAGGTEDQIVLCAGKSKSACTSCLSAQARQILLGGEVHIWDRETAKLLHSLRAQDQGSDLTGIAWNHASVNQLMFASAAHDGTVRIWTAPWDGVERRPSRSLHTQHPPSLRVPFTNTRPVLSPTDIEGTSFCPSGTTIRLECPAPTTDGPPAFMQPPHDVT